MGTLDVKECMRSIDKIRAYLDEFAATISPAMTEAGQSAQEVENASQASATDEWEREGGAILSHRRVDERNWQRSRSGNGNKDTIRTLYSNLTKEVQNIGKALKNNANDEPHT